MKPEFLSNFDIQGTCEGIEEVSRGHIHDTFKSAWEIGTSGAHFIHQKINSSIFSNVSQLMSNIEIISKHVGKKIDSSGTLQARLELIPTKTGKLFLEHTDGTFWRTFRFIDGISFEVCPNEVVAYECGKAFSEFTSFLVDLDPEKLFTVLPHFQDGLLRFQRLEEAIKRATPERLKEAEAEINFALARREQTGLFSNLQTRGVPLRITHSDPKLSNIIFSKQSKALAILDLDTCMPGTLLYDFGDMLRSVAVQVKEDQGEVQGQAVDQKYVEALIKGMSVYLSKIVTPGELALMGQAPSASALVLGIRFLTDFLEGDSYFKVSDDQQNLRRTRTQFCVAREFEELQSVLTTLIHNSFTR